MFIFKFAFHLKKCILSVFFNDFDILIPKSSKKLNMVLFSDEKYFDKHFKKHLNCNTKHSLKRKAISCYGPADLVFGRGNLEVIYSSVFLREATALKNQSDLVYCSFEYALTHISQSL